MATLDDSPSLFSGQQWTDWASSVISEHDNESNESDHADDNTVADSMKLRIEDMPLFGLCPSQDEFYLVVCDKCNQVLKPQAFQAHLDVRHGGTGSFSTSMVSSSSSTKVHQSSRHSVSSKSHSKSPSKSHRSHSRHHSKAAPSVHNVTPSLSLGKPPHLPLTISGHTIDTDPDRDGGREHCVGAKTSVKEPPRSFSTVTKVGAELDTDKVKDSKLKKNHTMPVVKVERMPETLAMKKQHESTGSARTSLTNGAIKGSKSPPHTVSVDVEMGDIDIKPPVLSEPQSPAVDQAMSEIDSAVNAILEPVSPVMEEQETSSFIALATSTSTLTTNTVTMATLTMSSTSVTNSTNTTSSFTFTNMGRPDFPTGSIRVNISSTGVHNVLSTSASNTNINNNSVHKNAMTSLSNQADSQTVKASVCSNGSIESTISDIVKSTINANNTGLGFKKLSPMLTSPVKGTVVASQSDSALKSPSGISNILKSASAINNSKSSSKLSLSGGTLYRSLSQGTVVSTSATTSSNNAVTSAAAAGNADALKKLQLLNKPDKIIPLKDREYDANKHCGVVVSETGKACTRSLTCKTHALSLRRAVSGRRLPFDELLKEHRESKEAYLKAKEAAAALKAASSGGKTISVTQSPMGKSHSFSSLSSPPGKQNAHLSQGLTKENKTLSMPVFTPCSKVQQPQKSTSQTVQRPSLSSLQVNSPQSGDEGLIQSKSSERLEESEDDSYTTYHPRPIAACSFGARYHNNYGSGFGCHTFGRRTDHLREAFLDLLEKHIHQPPHKKLCVEANLPKESETSSRSADPYEFFDPSRNTLGHHGIQGTSNMTSGGVPNKTVLKPKSKPSASVSSAALLGNKPKLKDTSALSTKNLGLASTLASGLTAAPSAKKRRSSGSSSSQSAINFQSSLGATIVSAPSIIASVGAITNSAGGGNPQFAIAIPSMNLSGNTLSQLNASLVTNTNLKHSKNNVIKDMGFVVTGIPQEAILNGQYVNITNAQLTADVSSNPLQTVTLDEGSKSGQQAHVIANKTASQPKFINSINSLEAIRALQAGKGGLMSLPANTLLLDGNLQPGTVLQQVSLTTSAPNPVSLGNTVLTSHNPTQVTTPSPYVRSGSDSPHVSSSPMPNGVISSYSDTEVLLSRPVFQTKTLTQTHRQPRASLHQTSHMFTGAQLQNQNIRFQNPTSSVTCHISTNTSQVLTTQLTQLQVKNSSIGGHKPGPMNKLTMQPVSLTIPFMSQPSVGGVGGQQTTHALFITSEEAQKQGLHLHQADQPAQNSPSDTLIS